MTFQEIKCPNILCANQTAIGCLSAYGMYENKQLEKCSRYTMYMALIRMVDGIEKKLDQIDAKLG